MRSGAPRSCLCLYQRPTSHPTLPLSFLLAKSPSLLVPRVPHQPKMAASELNALVRNCRSSRKMRGAHQVLDLLRRSQLHRPSLVLEFGGAALTNFSTETHQYWNIVADISRAACESGEMEIATSYLEKLKARFPKSPRCSVLQGLFHEAQGAFARAQKLYMTSISADPTLPLVYKRQVAVLKSENKMSEAIAFLNYYLSLYCDDLEAWSELCALCLRIGRLSHALFAAHELVTSDSGNFAHHILVADVYMTCGGAKNLSCAQVHYATSLNLRKTGNLRALYGLWLSSKLILSGSTEDQRQTRISQRLLDHATLGITCIYRSPEVVDTGSVEALLVSEDIFKTRSRPTNRGKPASGC